MVTQREEQERALLEAEKRQRELDDWKSHPTSRLFFQALRIWQKRITEQWAIGKFNLETIEGTALANHKATSEYGMIEQILNLDAEEIQGIYENDKDIN